jgi:hypothetical protein
MLPVEPELTEIQEQITNSQTLAGRIQLDARHGQLSISPKCALRVEDLWNILVELLGGASTTRFKVVRSCHSVDILATNVSKMAVVEQARRLAHAEPEEALRIGDQGRWPGNDYEMLAAFPSLSVDEVSSDISTCWNLAPAGQTGPSALDTYFSGIKFEDCGFHLDFSGLWKGLR